mmetsp:Transcript_83012/g.146412  ORF Transcript_83012/g.146412 Transcript_83012/m.146412 type:complete len:82 (-) Transcript_83012:68-313(-)
MTTTPRPNPHQHPPGARNLTPSGTLLRVLNETMQEGRSARAVAWAQGGRSTGGDPAPATSPLPHPLDPDSSGYTALAGMEG